MKRCKLISVLLVISLMSGICLSGCKAEGDGTVTEESVEVSASITEGSVTVDDSLVLETVSKDVSNVIINSHNVEDVTGSEFGEQYTSRDTVSITYSAGDLGGLLPQTVSKDLEFYKNGDTGVWEFLNEKTTACEVDTADIIGTSWKCDSLSADSLFDIFEGEIPDGDMGTLYFRFLKKIGAFAFNMDNGLNTPEERFFATVGTSAKIAWAGQAGVIEKSIKITEGSVTDNGILNLVLGSGDGSVILSFGDNTVQIKEQEYDLACGIEIDENRVYKDSLPAIEVTSDSANGGYWDQDIGLKYGNLSPELTWEAVDGAGCYAVFMVDYATNATYLFWFVVVDETHLDRGRYTDKTEYIGPDRPEPTDFVVYVVALKDEPKTVSYALDNITGDIDDKLNVLNTDHAGNTGNVLAYGRVRATYTQP